MLPLSMSSLLYKFVVGVIVGTLEEIWYICSELRLPCMLTRIT